MADKVIPVRISENMFDLMEVMRNQRNARTKGEKLTRSAWIREAIREKIAHAARSRRKPNMVTCRMCKLPVSLNDVAYSEQLLREGGPKEYTCKKCDDYAAQKTQPPLLDHGQERKSEPSTNVG